MAMEILTGLGPSSILLILLLVLSSVFLTTLTRRHYSTHNIPPYPEPPQFIFGHLFKFKATRFNLKKWRESAGDIFSLDMRGRLTVVVSGYKLIKEALIKQGDMLTNRPHVSIAIKGVDMNSGVARSSGARWKEERSVCLSILRDFGMGKNHLALKIHEEIDEFIKKLASFNGEPVDIKNLTNAAVSNIICSIIVGKRFEYDDPKFLRLTKGLSAVVAGRMISSMMHFFPFLQYLPFDLVGIEEYRKASQEVNENFAIKHIKEIRENLSEDDEPQNFIAAYLQELKKKETTGEMSHMNENQLTQTLRHLFIAGSETSSSTILWTIIHLMHCPHMQNKVYREIEDAVGLGRFPNLLDKPKLSYLNAVIMETQRIANIAPITLPRLACKDIQIGGYRIPKGSTVFMNLDSIMMEETVWGDPYNFRPERFLNPDGTLARAPDEFIPFSIGKRNCLGESMAKMELYLFLSALFQRFEFKPDGELPDLEGSYGTTHVPKPFQMRIIDRRF